MEVTQLKLRSNLATLQAPRIRLYSRYNQYLVVIEDQIVATRIQCYAECISTEFEELNFGFDDCNLIFA